MSAFIEPDIGREPAGSARQAMEAPGGDASDNDEEYWSASKLAALESLITADPSHRERRLAATAAASASATTTATAGGHGVICHDCALPAFLSVAKGDVTKAKLRYDNYWAKRVEVHTSHLTPHTSHLTPHTSHLTPHTSHLTPQVLRSRRHARWYTGGSTAGAPARAGMP